MGIEYNALAIAQQALALAQSVSNKNPIPSSGAFPNTYPMLFVGFSGQYGIAGKGPAAYGADPSWASVVLVIGISNPSANGAIVNAIYQWQPLQTGVSDGFTVIDVPALGFTGTTPGRFFLLTVLN